MCKIWHSSVSFAYSSVCRETWFPTERHNSECLRVKQIIIFLITIRLERQKYVVCLWRSVTLWEAHSPRQRVITTTFCYNNCNFYCWVEFKMYSKRVVGESCRPITDAIVEMRNSHLVRRRVISHSSKESILRAVTRRQIVRNSDNSHALLLSRYTENVRWQKCSGNT